MAAAGAGGGDRAQRLSNQNHIFAKSHTSKSRHALFVLLRARPGAAPVQAQVVQLPLVRTARTTRTRGSLTPSAPLP
eukprot:COSAG06_NODE_42958_length_376_cov_2.805054_1_plen_76_part_10